MSFLFAFTFFVITSVFAETAIPKLTARVTDLTQTLSAKETQALEQMLAQIEQQYGSQVALLLVPSTEAETIEQYGLRVVERWQLGRDKIDDGVLLLIAKNDRRIRIEVGYGLEGVLPDAINKRIIAETITPAFKRQQFYEGIAAGVQQIGKLIAGESLPPPKNKSRKGYSEGDALFVFAFLIFIVGSALRKSLGRLPTALLVGAGIGLVGWLMAALVMGLLIALVGFIATLVADVGGRGRGGFYAGGFGGGGFGGGSGGGGFSGGGGGFGGGGASGGW